jgi:hypothetical protein
MGENQRGHGHYKGRDPEGHRPDYLSSFFGATAARHGLEDLDLFAGTGVLDKMADVDDALVAGVGALQASVVRLYSIVVIVRRWVRAGCARLLCGHEVPLRGPGLGVLQHRRDHLSLTPLLY